MCSAAGWSAPPDGLGTREFIRVLLLLEKATLDELASAVENALGQGVADADTIDRAVRNALGLWATLCGPLRWMDLTGGPELYAKAMQGVLPTLCNADTLSPLLQQLAASGAQGIRNGRGFFNYTPGEAQRWEELYRQHAWRVTEMQNEYFPPKSKDAP